MARAYDEESLLRNVGISIDDFDLCEVSMDDAERAEADLEVLGIEPLRRQLENLDGLANRMGCERVMDRDETSANTSSMEGVRGVALAWARETLAASTSPRFASAEARCESAMA